MAIAADADDLPRTNVRRVVKAKLAELTKDAVAKKEISVHKEAVIAFSESAKIFIHYLSATANDICRESKRQTVNADDVLKAVEEIDFPEFLEPLRAALEEFRRDNAVKKQEAKEKGQVRKRKPDGDGEENEEAEKIFVSETFEVPAMNENETRETGDIQDSDIQENEE